MVKKDIENKKLKSRVARIKGQLNGLEQMLDDKKDCLEILNQLAAIKGALSALGLAITEEETGCLRIHKGDEKKLQDILNRFLKIN
ncbi:metal-sensitive transcriptional regulator [Patescibacteria group bacterium]|nr:metal-sensitive transcriptional regulator [Patescibacteria group bacterium]